MRLQEVNFVEYAKDGWISYKCHLAYRREAGQRNLTTKVEFQNASPVRTVLHSEDGRGARIATVFFLAVPRRILPNQVAGIGSIECNLHAVCCCPFCF